MLVSLLLLAWQWLSCQAALCNEPDQGPRAIAAVSVDVSPTIDGLLDDPCWQQATHSEGFWREKVDAPELEPTEAWICYDSRAIYLAFRCHDSKPNEIRCQQRKRQGDIWGDDHVGINLDVGNAGDNWYGFVVTPAGTQWDSVPGGTSEKIEWKGDWRAAATTDDAGWSAEIEVPFSILRYPDGQDTFRISFSRVLAREDDRCTWPPDYARLRDADKCARWTGLRTPAVPFRCALMPYALSVLSEDHEDREPLTAGFDAKGTFPNGVVGMLTYNPDFRNIEDVVETIDFTFVERYLPEYRPFFREGEYFLPSGIFYSRRIEDFDLGLKAFGALGQHRFGLLDTYRRGGENHLAWRYDRRFGTTAGLSLGGVDRRVPDEAANAAYQFTGWSWRPFEGGDRSYTVYRAWTHTAGAGGDDSRTHVHGGLSRVQGWSWHAGYESIGSDFRADDGYVPEIGVRNLSAELSCRRSYDEGPVRQTAWYLDGRTGQSAEGKRRGELLQYAQFWRNGYGLWAGAERGIRDGYDVVDNWIGGSWNQRDTYRTGDAICTWGEKYGQPSRYQSLSQAFRLGGRWSGQLRAERVYAADLDDEGQVMLPEWSRQLVLTATYDVTDEKTVSARLVRRAAGANVYAAYRQRVRKGMDLLIVVGDPNAEEWTSRLAVKAIWCY